MRPQMLQSLSEVAAEYDVLFCDLWGCLHDGVRAYPAAVAALQAFRRTGGAVILTTNAPRPGDAVVQQLERLQAPKDCYDAVVSSGDAALEAVAAGRWGTRVFHIGDTERDDAFFDAAPALSRVPMEDAGAVVVTGLRDDRTETPDDYADELRELQLRGLKMLNANPDLHVDVGEERRWCAGGLAAAYEAIGGESEAYGKPHPPIYATGRRLAESVLERPVDDDRILCLGDGILTDVTGAAGEGLDALFITGGLAAPRMGPDVEQPDPALLEEYLAEHRLAPRFAMGRLR